MSFLTGLSWSEVKVTSRVRGVWHVMAVPPVSDFPVSSWKYSLEGSDPACVIDVQVAESSARKVAVVAAVKGPSRRLAKESPAETVAAPGAKKVERAKSPAPTQMDPPGDGDGGDRGRSRSRERKPPRDAADSSNPAVSSGDAAPEPKRAKGNKTLHDPDAAVLNGWKIVDLQGVGDCFFRCVAFHQARRQKPQKLLNNTEAQTKGAWVRAQAKLHAQNHPETFSSLFDSEAAYKNWLSKVGKMTTYAEGAIIQAVSEKLGCPIVAWVKKEGCWERFVVSGRFANSYACCAAGQSPVVVLLENKHFTLLTPPTVEGADDTVPYAWLRATPTIVLDLTGGMVADDVVEEAEEAPCDGELDGEATPSLHSLVFSHEGDACSVDTPSLRTMVPASYVASRRSDAGLAVGTPSCVELPDACKSWECSVCHEFLPILPNRHSRDLSIVAHFKKRHPGVTLSEAYHQKQRDDPNLRSRMLKRGKHAGSVKRKASVDNLSLWADETGHQIGPLVLFCDPAKFRGQDVRQQLACSHCRRVGSPYVFMHHECSDEVTPLPVVSLAWMRELVKFDRRNLEILSTALHLSDEEKASLVVSAFRMHFKQPSWFVRCRQPAVAAGHKLRIFKPSLEEWPSGKASAGRLVGSLVLGA